MKEDKPLIQQGLKTRHVASSGFAAFDPNLLILLLSNVFSAKSLVASHSFEIRIYSPVRIKLL